MVDGKLSAQGWERFLSGYPGFDRRMMLAGMGTALLAAKAPASALIKPPRLRPGDVVGLVEPAGFTDDMFDLAVVRETILAMGLKPKPARHLVERYGYLAGKDEDRAADVNAMFADPEVRAVFAVRGGWGCGASRRPVRQLRQERRRSPCRTAICRPGGKRSRRASGRPWW